ncbi:hypothetical protein GOP47_0003526 [Adiantum capillus-veneris]|uniref:Uncharacterized protein n=1 Tax=Adiantum capillus-veneris TaxID=13818 RepID=A0A9D4ZQ87_ADICA|nr:hypothetical protein GOP47_0003526 [Adiantum capillus-veneris]
MGALNPNPVRLLVRYVLSGEEILLSGAPWHKVRVPWHSSLQAGRYKLQYMIVSKLEQARNEHYGWASCIMSASLPDWARLHVQFLLSGQKTLGTVQTAITKSVCRGALSFQEAAFHFRSHEAIGQHFHLGNEGFRLSLWHPLKMAND